MSLHSSPARPMRRSRRQTGRLTSISACEAQSEHSIFSTRRTRQDNLQARVAPSALYNFPLWASVRPLFGTLEIRCLAPRSPLPCNQRTHLPAPTVTRLLRHLQMPSRCATRASAVRLDVTLGKCLLHASFPFHRPAAHLAEHISILQRSYPASMDPLFESGIFVSSHLTLSSTIFQRQL